MQRMTDEERRSRLVRRHLLAPDARAGSLVDAARALVAIHSSDPVSVFLGARARMCDPRPSALERELYEDRTVIRMLGMRRTLFVVPRELASVVQMACTRTVAARERARLLGYLEQVDTGEDAAAWLAEIEGETHRALVARGEASTTDLYADVPRLGVQMLLAAGRRYQAQIRLGTRVLPLLAAQGLAVRGRPRGTWISSQYRWHPIERWLPDGMAALAPQEAVAELVRRWLGSFGPGTMGDLRWWTGLTVAAVKRALADVGAVEVGLEGGSTGFVLADDLEPEPESAPAAVLLPALDSTVMGWTERSWFLGPHVPRLFDTNGNGGPTVWWRGRVVGGWAQRRDGEIAVRLLEDVGREGEEAVGEEAGQLRRWLGGIRFTPRFRTPLERELAS